MATAARTYRKTRDDKNTETLYAGSIETPLGRVWAAASGAGVVCVTLPGATEGQLREQAASAAPNCKLIFGESTILSKARGELSQYFGGRRKVFTVPVDLRVSGFSALVLRALEKVAFGGTLTYGELARLAGRPGAARAAGAALARNPIPIILPCHRIVASNGLGGFAGKQNLIQTKIDLLRLERESK